MRLIVLILLGALLWFVASFFFVFLVKKIDKKPIYTLTFIGAVIILLGGIFGIYKLGEYWEMTMAAKIVLGLSAMGVLVASMVNDRSNTDQN